MRHFTRQRRHVRVRSAGNRTVDVGSAVSWMEGDSRHHGRVLEMGEDRDYRPEPREGDTTRKDYGVAGVHEGTVISLPRKGSPFYRIRLDKDDEDDDTGEEDMTWSELAASSTGPQT